MPTEAVLLPKVGRFFRPTYCGIPVGDSALSSIMEGSRGEQGKKREKNGLSRFCRAKNGQKAGIWSNKSAEKAQ
jgi:hypothetical protein